MRRKTMIIQILGKGCPNCRLLEQRAREALHQLDMKADIEKVEDPDRIMEMGVMITPALAVDGTVKSSGKVLTAEEIARILKSS